MSRLVYLIGASGVGKDTLLAHLKHQAGASHRYLVAHRYITRPASADDENHIVVSEDEFRMRAAAGLFSMHWASHGYQYGIGKEIDIWLEADLHVIVNGSRAYLHRARASYPQLVVVKLSAPLQSIEQRLRNRKRESITAVEDRLQRALSLDRVDCDGLIEIDNNGPIEQTAARFLAAVGAAGTGR